MAVNIHLADVRCGTSWMLRIIRSD